MIKFLRAIRFDDTDDNVFEMAARPGEWAVSGAFAFADLEPAEVTGKTRQAFANGFLSVASWGRSTFATVARIEQGDLEDLEQELARHFVAQYGAPDIEAALPAARDETAFIRDLCEVPFVNTVFMLRRRFDEEGRICEEFRTVQASGDEPAHARIWSIVADDE